MRYSGLVDRINVAGSNAWELHSAGARRQRTGEDIILLSIGDHEFDTPAPIVDTAVASLRNGRHHYVPAGGDHRLRDTIARHHEADTGISTDRSHIVVLPGAQCGLFCVAACLFESGDEVLVTAPMYATYEGTLRASGATVVPVPLRPENRFHLEINDLSAAIGPRTRGVLINSPHNPTGVVFSCAELQAIVDICRTHDLWLISDEVYAPLTFDAPHLSPVTLADAASRTVVVSSLSKSHAMTGWRIGWVVAPPTLAGHIENLAGYMLFGVPPFVQDAAVFALDDAPGECGEIRERYRMRRDLVCDRLSKLPTIRFHRPEGAMYVMIDIRATGLSSLEFAWGLLDSQGLSLLPGEGFGEAGAGHVRFSLSAPESVLAAAVDRLDAYLCGLSLPRAG